MEEGDLVLNLVVVHELKGKLYLNWEGSFHVRQKLSDGAYKLEILEGEEIQRAWNIVKIRYY